MQVIQLPVDQAGHGPHPRRVAAAVVAVGLRQRREDAHPAEGVLGHDAAAGEGAIVGDVLRRARLAARLLARRGAQPSGVGGGVGTAPGGTSAL